MRKVVHWLAVAALVASLAGIALVLYTYLSISPNDSEIVECARNRVPALVTPPAPIPTEKQVGTKEQEVCTKVPVMRGLKVSVKNRCVVVARTPLYETQAVTDTEIKAWQAQVAQSTEAWRLAMESAAQHCANEARDRMKAEIVFWSNAMSGPAPYLVALFGVVGVLATKRPRRRVRRDGRP